MSKPSRYIARHPDANGYIAYDDADNAVWRDLITRQLANVQRYCSVNYINGLERLSLPQDRVPQCDEVSDMIEPFTGWRVSPVPAVIGFEPFFKMLSERRFPAASFIRHREDFDYIREPDIFHEIFGHMPLLTDSRFAGFSHAIGLAGLKAGPKEYAWLIRLYWFTIEFGLSRENGEVKALGSGLASSPTELPYSVKSTAPQRRVFDVQDILRTPYRIDIHQPVYFVLDDVDDLFNVAGRDLLKDVRKAQSKGLFAPEYPPKEAA